MNPHIIPDSEVCGGEPCIKGTRIPVHVILSHLDNCHVIVYNWQVIKTFADRYTLELYETGKSKRLPP